MSRLIKMYAFGLSLISTNLLAIPSISNVEQTNTSTTNVISVTLSGENFGSAPTLAFYNGFSGDLDNSIPNGSATVTSSSPIQTIKYKNRTGFQVVDTGTDTYNIIRASLEQSVNEVFISYAVTVPEGYTAPNALTPNAFNQSSWKFSWLLQHEGANSSSESFDICPPTQVGDSMYVGGNSSKYLRRAYSDQYRVGKYSEWWDWSDFNYINYWVKGDPSNNENSPTAFTTMNALRSFIEYPFDPNVLKLVGPNVSVGQVNIPGWTRNTNEDNFQAIYDDIYIAVGDNSRARIELTDSRDYASSSMRMPVPTIGWNEAEITANLDINDLSTEKNYFIHVFDGNGERTLEGTSIDLCLGCPKSPPSLSASQTNI